MSFEGQVDVVVVGFGVVGATAALAAAITGASVLVLDQDPLLDRRRGTSRPDRARDALRSRLRATARAAGVRVRSQCRVHELLMDGGQVSGLGYAELPATGAGAAGHRWARRLGEYLPGGLAPVLGRAAERVWRSGSRVGEVRCRSVILAVDPSHWEFVGPAMWTAARARGNRTPRPRRSLYPVEDGPAPELAVRTWCALQEASFAVASRQRALRVDKATGSVIGADGSPVPGLFSAVHAADEAFELDAMMSQERKADWLAVSALARPSGTWCRSAV